MTVEIVILNSGDRATLQGVALNVFDRAIDPKLCEEFLNDPRHHLAAAVDGAVVIGIASAVHYVHPDKPPELWINEVAVAPTHRQRGIARRLLQALFALGRTLGCRQAWVLTDRSNVAAMKLYQGMRGAQQPQDQVMFTFNLCSGLESE